MLNVGKTWGKNFSKNKKPLENQEVFKKYCGERGIRTPGGVTLAGFQDQCIRPLCHFSNCGCKYKTLFEVAKDFLIVF